MQVQEAKHKSLHIVWFHFYEMFIDKSIETERLEISRGWGEE